MKDKTIRFSFLIPRKDYCEEIDTFIKVKDKPLILKDRIIGKITTSVVVPEGLLVQGELSSKLEIEFLKETIGNTLIDVKIK